MTALVLSDLDRTLIYSAGALRIGVPDEEAPRLLCVELYHARPLSYVTERAAHGIAALNRAAALVPTTTRTAAQYRRIHLPGPAPRLALVANGGMLLCDGRPDAGFSARVADRLASGGAPFAEVWARLRTMSWRESSRAFIEKAREADGLFCYAVVDRERLPSSWIAELTGFCTERGWRVSVQGRKVYCVPAALSKGVAAHEVATMAGADRLLAAGDSLLDAELLEAAELGIRPAHGELHDAGWTAPHVTITAACGVAAGEQIVAWLGARAEQDQ
ncbi:MAG: HAD family hydrolase [Nocardioides sp.]|uniref:HAD family hydrolase n=1 Tax=Nocardioides sp. TaxID=35761 RepID=UPI0039E32B16